MVRFPGFIGPSYSSQSLSADCQTTMNWIPELIESGKGKSVAALYPTPGLKTFAFHSQLSVGPENPTVAVNDPASGTQPWANPANAEVSDDTYATVTVTAPPAGSLSVYLALSSFGLAIPLDATIFGIAMDVEAHFTSTGAGGILGLHLIKGGVVQPTTQKLDGLGSYGAGDAVVHYGGSTDLWNLPWSPAELNAAGFGVGLQIRAIGPVRTTATFFVDVITVTIWYRTPLAGNSIRAMHCINGRLFATSGPNLYEIDAAGTATVRGTIAVGTGLDSIASGPLHLLIISGGTAYSYVLATNTLAPVIGMLGTPKMAGFSDGYFIVLLANSRQFQISGLLDATSWDGLDTTQISVFPDNINSMLVDHREVWLFGKKQSVVYWNSGNTDFPFDVITGAFLEEGSSAQSPPVKLDNSILWLGGGERGAGIGWRAEGYTPRRLTNHAIEHAWQAYPDLTDARSYAYQQDGHSFWVVYFPSANATWVFDSATGLWHERGYWNTTTGKYNAHHSQCYAYAFGKHLVGDWNSGNVYEMDIDLQDDAGAAIRRMRRAPHLSNEQKWLYHKELQIDLEVGLGPIPPLLDGDGNARSPKVMLRWSNDGGKTWGNTHQLDAGKAGEYKTRLIARRLGRSRDRVYEISATDAIPFRIIDCYLDVEAGTS